jgi:hypothetical protein
MPVLPRPLPDRANVPSTVPTHTPVAGDDGTIVIVPLNAKPNSGTDAKNVPAPVVDVSLGPMFQKPQEAKPAPTAAMPALPAAGSPAAAAAAKPKPKSGSGAGADAATEKKGFFDRISSLFESSPEEKARLAALKANKDKLAAERKAREAEAKRLSAVPRTKNLMVQEKDARPITNDAEFKKSVVAAMLAKWPVFESDRAPIAHVVDAVAEKVDLVSPTQWGKLLCETLRATWNESAFSGKDKAKIDYRKTVALGVFLSFVQVAFNGGTFVSEDKNAALPAEFKTVRASMLGPFIDMSVKKDGKLIDKDKFASFVDSQARAALLRSDSAVATASSK